MDLRLHVGWLTLFACGRPGDRMSDVPKGPIPEVRDARVSAVIPSVDLGPEFEPIAFVPGRYAALVERNMVGAHARSLVTHRSRASLVVDLVADGSATACLGWTHAHAVDGSEVQQHQEFQLQQGFRGSQVVRDGEIEVVLVAHDALCAATRKGDTPALADAMTLRCVMARPRGHATLVDPVLLCDWREADWFAYYPLAAGAVAPERWILLGGGNGVSVRISGKPVSTSGAPEKVSIEPSPDRIEPSAWDRPLPLPEPSDGL